MNKRPTTRGTRDLALPGIMMIATSMLLVVFSAWWSFQSTVDTREKLMHARLESAMVWIESGLDTHEFKVSTTFRRMIHDLTQDELIERARVSVGDKDRIVVASSVLTELDHPRDSLGTSSEERFASREIGELNSRVLIEVWGAEPGAIEISQATVPFLWIACGGLTVMLVLYRFSRNRFRAISPIANALVSFGAGESSTDALRVNPETGPVSTAWNALLDSRERLRVEQLVQSSGSDRRAGAEDALVSSAVGALPMGVMILSSQDRSRYTNTAAEIMLENMNSSEPSGDRLELCGVRKAVGTVVDGQRRARWSTEIESGDAQGSVFRVTVRPLDGIEESVALVLIEDVTKQRLAEEARTSFLARATHELRTPLTNIRLYAEQATDENETDPAERNRAINVINQESRRLERLVGDMLSSAEIENGSLDVRINDLRLDAFFKELEHDYKAQAEQKGIAMTFALPPKLPVISADREKLALAMHNLIGNALKYTTRGGIVEIGFDIEQDGTCRFRVQDNGFGISPEDQDRLFDPYFRSSDKRIQHITGSGIGLGLARDVAKLHGGNIDLESVPDKGSTFTLWIPGGAATKAA